MCDLNQTNVWIFCRVIDNFGDAGVAWRLAKNLQHDLSCQMVLVIDNFTTLGSLLPELNGQENQQKVNQINIIQWNDEQTLSGCLKNMPNPDLVIETFACELPDCVKEIILQNKALWLNWEYLTAENWAEDMHLLPSLQANGANKYFYFMGFSEKSGGLLREKSLLPTAAKPVSGSLNAKNVSMVLIDTIQVMKKIAKVIMVACGFLPNKIFCAFGTDFVVCVLLITFIVFAPQ